VNELYNIGYILRVLRYETTGNKQKLKRKNCSTHIYCNNTCLFHTMRIVIRAPHGANWCGGFVGPSGFFGCYVMAITYSFGRQFGLRTSNHRRCSPRGHLRLHMSMKSTTSRAGPFSQEWTARNGTVSPITVKKRHLCSLSCLAETCALNDSSGCSPTADTN